jgi:peptide/nickel transport system substrate-binding protein/oligopeptide transport system substrate-binding protein
LQPATRSPFCPNFLSPIKDADKLAAGKIATLINDSLLAPDASTVKIVLNKPVAYFLDALTLSCSYVVERSLITKYGIRFTDHLSEGGGDGPFMVKEYTHNKRIVFVPNPTYYGPKPQLREVIYPFMSSADTAYLAYQTNQIDTAIVPAAQVASARKLANEFHQVPQLTLSFYTMNYLTKPFDNIKIRQAFELAIDKDVIAHVVWKDTVIATNHIIPMGMPGYNPHLTGPAGTLSTAGNPVLAVQLFQQGMREEGWSNVAQVPSITLSYASFGFQPLRNEVAVLIETWQKVLGVSVHPQELEFGKLIDEFLAATNNPHGLQMWGIGWGADYPDPQDLVQSASIGVATNYAHNSSADVGAQQAVQQQLAAAVIDQDPQHRLQQYRDAEQKLVNDVFWLPMYQLTSTFVLKPCVRGLVFNEESVIPPNDWANVYISMDTPCAQPS